MCIFPYLGVKYQLSKCKKNLAEEQCSCGKDMFIDLAGFNQVMHLLQKYRKKNEAMRRDHNTNKIIKDTELVNIVNCNS